MAKRQEMTREGSQNYFSATASKTHRLNMPRTTPMRGGIRL